MKVLTRYLIRTHIGPLLFAFFALTSVLLINVIAKELANLAGKGLPFDVVVEFFLLSLPANIALTLPMAVLVAVLYTFSTLAADNEISALRASGVDLRRAALPLVVLAGLIAGGMAWFNDRVLPASNLRWRVLMTDVAQARPLLAVRPQTLNGISTANGLTAYFLESREVNAETGQLREVSIYDVSDPSIIRTINADSGSMVLNHDQTDLLLTLHNGHVREVNFEEPQNFQVIEFQSQVMRIRGVSDRLERNFGSDYRTDRDMTSRMMFAAIDSLRAERAKLVAPAGTGRAVESGPAVEAPVEDARLPAQTVDAGAVDPNAPAFDLTEDPIQVVGEDPNGAEPTVTAGEQVGGDSSAALGGVDTVASGSSATDPRSAAGAIPPAELDRFTQGRIENIDFQIREYQLEIHKKFSIAGATLVFVLIGIPLALRFPRGGIGMVVATSLAIFGIYYVGLIGGESLGDRGYVPPAIAMWSTNAIFGVLGLIGFIRLGNEQGTARGSGWGDAPRLPGWIRRRVNRARNQP
jgi:lipopolysaccharide export system permease protein